MIEKNMYYARKTGFSSVFYNAVLVLRGKTTYNRIYGK